MDERGAGPNHSAGRQAKRRKPSAKGFYTPFRDLDQHLEKVLREKRLTSSELTAPIDEVDIQSEGERLFREAMKGVIPIADRPRKRVPRRPLPKQPPRFLAQEELNAYHHLLDLVSGDTPFELSCSDEYIDGAIQGLSPNVLKKLRNGDFSYQAHLDLHGLNREQALPMVVQFIQRSFAQKRRCVLIVSGRGLNSLEKEPVLKHSLVRWLTHAPLKRLVLAFASARSYDGGAGAFYVLLRRNEANNPILVPAP